jgi:hypothetical protein
MTVGIPLSATKTVTLRYSQSEKSYDAPDGPSIDGGTPASPFERQRLFTAKWIYNTTNAPFFPTRGVILGGGPEVRWSDSLHYLDFEFDPIGTIHLPIEQRGHSVAFGLQAGRYWEISERNSVSLLAAGELEARKSELSFGNVTDETQRVSDHTQYGRIDLGFSHSFWAPERIAVDGDQRIEVHLRAFGDRYEQPPSDSLEQSVDRIAGEQLSVSWVRRNAWGAIRIGVAYAW